MATRDVTQVPQPAGTTVTLPIAYPRPPDKLLDMVPGFKKYHEDTERIYRLTREAIRNTADDLALPINKALNQAPQFYASIQGLTARIEYEVGVLVGEDEALAHDIETLSLTITGTGGYADRTASLEQAMEVRINKEGDLTSTYTLTATVDHVTTGMRLISGTSTTPGHADISSVIFQAGVFQIYNGVSGIPVFDLNAISHVLTLNAAVVINASNVSGLGDLALVDSISWLTNVNDRPAYLTDSRIPTAINSAGLLVTGAQPGVVVSTGGASGLYLGSDYLGYYNGSAWKTYMDNTGQFFLGGTSGSLQWNGTTLSITGYITLLNTMPYTSVTGGPPAGADVTLSAVNGGLTLTGGGLNLSSGGSAIRSGQTAYNTGVGFWLGDQSGPKFSIGNGTNHSLKWDGSTLTISGSITLTNTIPSSSVSGLGTFATISSLAYGSLTGAKPPTNADVTLTAIEGKLTLNGGGLVLASAGASISGGQTAFDTGTGFWLGDVSGTSKFSIGKPTSKMTWNGTNLVAGGFTIGANDLSGGSGGSYIAINSSATSGITWGDAGATHGKMWQNGAVTILEMYANATIVGAALSADASSGGVLYLRNPTTGAANIAMSGQTGHIILGTDTHFYRSAAQVLKIDGSLTIGTDLTVTGLSDFTGNMTINGDILIPGASRGIKYNGSNAISFRWTAGVGIKCYVDGTLVGTIPTP